MTTIIDAIKCKLMEDCIMHNCFKGTVALYLYEYSTEKSRNNENQDPYVLLDPIFYTVYILPMS